jgi:LmbE family N-acetylglucosaminyl deacetylase
VRGSDGGVGAGSGSTAAILLVEDDELLAEVVVGLLAPLGAVRWTDNAEEALTLLPASNWELIVADIELPGMNGIEMIERLKREHPHTSTLIVSGRASFDYAIEAIRAGADDYMTKPLEPEALVDKARELIDKSRASRAADHQVVLAIGAHPDDVEIGVGGILLRHADAGHDVNVLTLTGGEHGGDAAERAAESQYAAEILGARLFHESLQDTEVGDRGETIGAIKRVIDESGATTIYTHTSKDVHQDHRNVHNATLVAARGLPRVYCYQAPSTTVDFRPTRFVGIDEVIDRKIEAIGAFASQTAIRTYLDEELLRATARYWARYAQSRYVEPLEVVREAEATAPAIPAASGRPMPSSRDGA